MKSSYTDNFKHSLVFVPPVYTKKVKGQKVRTQAPVVVLKHCDDYRSANDAKRLYDAQYAKRPGKIVVRRADEATPHVGRHGIGKSLPKQAA